MVYGGWPGCELCVCLGTPTPGNHLTSSHCIPCGSDGLAPLPQAPWKVTTYQLTNQRSSTPWNWFRCVASQGRFTRALTRIMELWLEIQGKASLFSGMWSCKDYASWELMEATFPLYGNSLPKNEVKRNRDFWGEREQEEKREMERERERGRGGGGQGREGGRLRKAKSQNLLLGESIKAQFV